MALCVQVVSGDITRMGTAVWMRPSTLSAVLAAREVAREYYLARGADPVADGGKVLHDELVVRGSSSKIEKLCKSMCGMPSEDEHHQLLHHQ